MVISSWWWKRFNYKFIGFGFSGTSQKELGLTGMKVGEKRGVNLFKSGVDSNSLAFGKVTMFIKAMTNSLFSRIALTLTSNGKTVFSARNLGTVLGGAANYNLWLGPGFSINANNICGPFDVHFTGLTLYLNKK